MAEEEPQAPQIPEAPQVPATWSPPPPPPTGGYHGGADIPPDSPDHRNPQRQGSRNSAGLLGGGGILAYLLKAGIFGKFLLSGGTFLLSYGLYALALGPLAALGILVMIFVHEMGHVVEIQRQGLRATAPVFIPFMGAAIFQRQLALDAVHQAEIGIAGPIAGTVGATAAFAAFGATHWPPLLVWAWFGFFINLINLIPAGMLDGGWILAPVSKWFQVLGLAIVVGLVLSGLISPIFLLFVVIGLPMTLARFRAANAPYFTSASPSARLALGISWLVLVVYLVIASVTAEQALRQFVG